MINRIARKIYNQYRLSIIAKKVFDAALTDQQKTLVDEYTNKRRKSLSFGPMFSSDRTYFNIGKSSLATIETPQEIVNILDRQGYYCPDYRSGYVYKKDDKLKHRSISLIKVLRKCGLNNDQFNRLKKQFDQRLGTSHKQMKSCLICITHNPYDVAGMSTDRSWTSCMELPGINNQNGGCNYDTALKQVQYGGMCAYLIQNNDKQIERPLARIAIKRLVGDNDGFIFIAQTRIYGDSDFAEQLNFVEEVEKILDESNEKTLGVSKIFQRKDENSWTDSDIYEKYMFKDDDQMMQYIKDNFEKCIRNEKFMESLIDENYLIDEQWQSLFPYFIKDIDINYEEKISYLYKLIDNEQLTEEQEKLAVDIMIKKQDIKHLCLLIVYNKLTEEQKKSAVDIMIKKQDTQNLYQLISYDRLTEEQEKFVIDFFIKKQDIQNLYRLIYHDKLTEKQRKSAISVLIKKQGGTQDLCHLINRNKLTSEQRKLAMDIIFKKQEAQDLYWLIKEDKLTEEQKKLAVDIMIKKQDTQNLYQLIINDKLTEEQKKSAINVLIKKQDTKHLYLLIVYNKLTEEQKKSAVDIMIKKQDTDCLCLLISYDELTEEQKKSAMNIIFKKQGTKYLYKLIYYNRLTKEQRKLVINLMIKKQDTQNLYWLIKQNKLTEQQIKQFNLSYLE